MRSKAIFMALLAFAFSAQAVPVSIEQVRSAAQAWVRGGRPGLRLGARLGTTVDRVSARKIADGGSFFEVRLRNEQEARSAGTLIMSADTTEAPVIAFSPEAVDLSKVDRRSPLWALLSADSRLRSRQRASIRRSEGRWARLLAAAPDAAPPIHGDSSPVEIDDLRVDVLLKTKWGQSDFPIEGGGPLDLRDPCFNYYTPNNYVCGCVATATAQIMRYYCWPTNEVEVFTMPCTVDGAAKDLKTLGGVFDWANMPEKGVSSKPEDGELQCQAIGRLAYECGVSVKMEYAEDGSGAVTADVPPALKKRFGYANAQWFDKTPQLTGNEKAREEYIYPSLDAGCPVLLSIRGVSGGHAVVGDGYGYSTIDGEKVPYVHINMGWTGQNDWWYNLPEINTGDNPEDFDGFDSIEGVVYNIFPDTTGRIVSGRVLDVDGNPVAGVEVKLAGLETKTSEHGVYAFVLPLADFPSGSYTVSSKSEDDKYVGVYDVTLSDSLAQNYWGCDIKLGLPSVRIGTEIYATLNNALEEVHEGDKVEILLPTEFRRDVTVLASCTILATNPVASASIVTYKAGALLTVGEGVRVLFTNVDFEGEGYSDATVSVQAGGIAAVSGFVDIYSFKTEDVGGFELAGAITTAMFVDCPNRTAGTVFGTITGEGVEGCVNQIRNPHDEELGGTVDGSGLVWEVAPVPDVATVVRLEQGVTSENFLSFGRLLRFYTGDAVITVCRKCPFTNQVTVVGSLSIVSENAVAVIVADGAGFSVPTGTRLSIGNVVLDGRNAAKVKGQFFAVNGGALTLEGGTAVRGITCTGGSSMGGAVLLQSGELTMRPGSEIRNCRAEGDGTYGVYGGGIAAAGGQLNLLGGTITACFAAKNGGGVYTATETVLGGDLRVEGNSSGSFSADDLYVYGKGNLLKIADELSGAKVGVRHSAPALDKAGAVFATVEAAAPSGRVFFSDANERLIGEIVDAEVRWQDVDPRICPEEDAANAVARVVRPDGSTDLWYAAADALEGAGDGCVVELLKDDVLARKVVLPSAGITFRTAAEAESGPLTLSRTVDCGITVPSGASLTLTDVVLSGVVDLENDPDSEEPLLDVNGGSLRLDEGSEICDVYGDKNRAASAVVVWNGGTVILDGGSIHDCVNAYVDDVKGVEGGCGAAILVEGAGSSAELLAGQIIDCFAERGGAVFVSDYATISMSGDVSISDNALLDFKTPSNLKVADLSELVLVDALAEDSRIGYTEGYRGPTNVFGSVDGAYYAQATASAAGRTALTNSAACFVHDLRRVHGVVATNDTDTALLVWSDAFVDEGGTYSFAFVDEAGVEHKYWSMGDLPAPEPPPEPQWEVVTNHPTPIAFKSIDRVSETEWHLVITDRVEFCNYRLLWATNLVEGFVSTGAWEHAVGELAESTWETNVVTTGGAWFWRAEGADGTNMVLKVEK